MHACSCFGYECMTRTFGLASWLALCMLLPPTMAPLDGRDVGVREGLAKCCCAGPEVIRVCAFNASFVRPPCPCGCLAGRAMPPTCGGAGGVLTGDRLLPELLLLLGVRMLTM